VSHQSACTISLPILSAAADIPARRFTTFKATNGVALPGSAGEPAAIVGITAESYDHSQASAGLGSTTVAVARLDGAVLEVEAGEALTVGQAVIAGDDGRAMAATTVAGPNLTAGPHQVVGIVKAPASAAGVVAEIISIRGQVLTLA